MTTTIQTTATTEEQAIPPVSAMPEISMQAAVLHSNLEPELRQRISAALSKAGYAPRFLTPSDLGEPGSTESGPWDVLKGFGACVLVEPFGEQRSVYEYLLLLRASWETEHIPVAVVLETTKPDPFRALAFHTLGITGLASRDAPESLDCLFQWTGRGTLSNDALAVILFADDEARRAGQEKIGTEHLLLGLLRDAETAWLLRADLNVAPARIADAVRQRMERRPEYARHQWRYLTEEAKSALHLARGEAAESSGSASASARHLLLGLIGEPDGLAGRVLADLDITCERIRKL